MAKVVTGLSTWLTHDSVSIPLYVAKPTDPPHELLYNPQTWNHIADGSWRTHDNTPEVETEIKVGARKTFPFPYHPYVSQSAEHFVPPRFYKPIRNPANGDAFHFAAPEGIQPTSGTDGHMVVFEQDGSAVETYSSIVLSNNIVVALSYQVTSVKLAGDGSQNGVTASMMPVYAGLLRAKDLDAGVIQHALKIVVPAALLAPSFVYPALSFDRGAMTENPPYSGTLPMGSRLALPPGLQLSALRLETQLGRMIAAAAKCFGFIITDRGGLGVTVVTEAGLGDRLRWTAASQRDLDKILRSTQQALMPPNDLRK